MKTKTITTAQQKARGVVLSSITILATLLMAPMANAEVVPFIIDDFESPNFTQTVIDETTGNGAVTNPTGITGNNTVMNILGGRVGWTRSISAELLTGTRMTTSVCGDCLQGLVTMFGGGSSTGIGTFTYSTTTNPVDLSNPN
ncbi:MAG: hypothetical protein LJE83_12220, partial [Gammaproteobacteria bacterium]|nr:hypothetical protein [Gammaproteobacteria bacterium]